MSISDLRDVPTAEIAAALEDRCNAACETGTSDISDRDFARAFGAMIRLLAARAQAGTIMVLTSGNSTISATDGVIACTAILETVGVEVFELSAWQALTDVGSRRRSRPQDLSENPQ